VLLPHQLEMLEVLQRYCQIESYCTSLEHWPQKHVEKQLNVAAKLVPLAYTAGQAHVLVLPMTH